MKLPDDWIERERWRHEWNRVRGGRDVLFLCGGCGSAEVVDETVERGVQLWRKCPYCLEVIPERHLMGRDGTVLVFKEA